MKSSLAIAADIKKLNQIQTNGSKSPHLIHLTRRNRDCLGQFGSAIQRPRNTL